MHNRSVRLTFIAASVAGILASAQAAAQQAQLEEVVVTARQRAEKIEDVPVTVQAFTANDIEAAGIERPQDFIALTSGVSQVQTAEAGDMQVSIRGINTGRDAETNFALVIDGVLQTNPNALNQELSNVTQIEVLKGPQGALYGRNAVAGAMIITTRKPGDSFEAEVGAGAGDYGSYKGHLYMAGPLSSKARASLSAYYTTTDGQWRNSLLNCSDCVDYYTEKGVIGRLIYDVGDSGTLDFKAKYSKVSSGAINFNASLALAEAAAYLGSLGVPYAAAFWEDPNKHDFVYINNIKPDNGQENINLSVKGDFDAGVGTLTTVVAYNDQKNYFLTDGTSAAFYLYSLTPSCQASNDARPADPLPPPFGPYVPSNGFVTTFFPPYGPTTCDGYQYQERNQKDASIEVRLTSPGDQRLRWVGGVYGADITRDVVVAQGSDNGQGFVKQPLVLTGGPNPTDLLYDDTFHSKVYAGFGQIAYDLVPNLELALAARYDSEQRSVDNHVPKLPPQTPGFFGTNNYINPAYVQDPSLASIPNRHKTYSQFQPKVSLNWKTTDHVTLFASYGYGFRSGGFNSTGSNATVELFYSGLCLGPTQASAPYVPVCTGSNRSLQDVNDDYKKEVSKAAEAGFKATLLNDTLALNAAVYDTKVENLQFFNFLAGPFGLLRVVTNAQRASIKGFEMDARWRVGQYVTLFGGYGYTDTSIDRYDGRPYTKGNKIPYAPDYTGNAGIDLALPLGHSSWTMNAELTATFVGTTWFGPVQKNLVPNMFTYYGYGQGDFSKQKRDPYSLMNARVTFSNGTWSIAGWGRNITDKKYLQEIIPAPEFGGSFIHDSPGASYGVEASYSFK